jgi:hypothetical protein
MTTAEAEALAASVAEAQAVAGPAEISKAQTHVNKNIRSK